LRKRLQSGPKLALSPSKLEWALLLLALFTAAVLRFWELGQIPSGLYRDEAFNGLDALKVLDGNLALFFPANNGREPLYIYLTSLAIAVWGRSIFAVRFAAALVGTLSTIPIFGLGKIWFGRRAGILAAFLWAITLWPVHLSRVGLRTILIVPILAGTFWLATAAYRKQSAWLMAAAGIVYGLGFYSYLAYRFTPLLLVLLAIYLILTGRGKQIWPPALWFAAGTAVSLAPFAYTIWQEPQFFLGRSGQVSILNPDVYGDSVFGALGRNILAAAGMFLWRGDHILRHNPIGRPVFDPLLAVPFVIGLGLCVKHWREVAAMTLLLWLIVMLGPTILAADAPHFLRAAGVLPAAVLVPAIGLAWLWGWERLPDASGGVLVGALLLGSLIWTVHDYLAYVRDPQLDFAFEAAATELAEEINAGLEQGDVFLDGRLWTSWPSLAFLTTDENAIRRYESADDLPASAATPARIFAWPYDSLEFVADLISPPVLVTVEDGALTRGDLEETAYPLYVQYALDAISDVEAEPLAIFGDQIVLQALDVTQIDPYRVKVDIYWQSESAVNEDLTVFAHVLGSQGIAAQVDRPLGAGRWAGQWWRPGVRLHETYVISLEEPFDPSQQQIAVGLYSSNSGERLPVKDAASGQEIGDVWVYNED
jgi:4-amino-4-deoxy-L-arabinose transferase-like glycosyltransferase